MLGFRSLAEAALAELRVYGPPPTPTFIAAWNVAANVVIQPEVPAQ